MEKQAVEEVDLTGVDPVRRVETLRRILIVQRYLALAAPTRAEDEAFADEVGVGVNQFMLLVRTWRLHGRASAMPGATRSRLCRPGDASHLGAAAAALVEAAIADRVGGGASEIHKAANAAALDAGLGPISFNAVTKRLDAARRASLGTAGRDPVLVLGRCAADLPVLRADGGLAPATLALAVSRPDGFVLGAVAGTATDMPSVSAALAQAARNATPCAREVRLQAAVPEGSERRRLSDLLSICGLGHAVEWIDARARPDASVQALLGAVLGPLRLTAARTRRPAERHARLRALGSEPVPEGELDGLVAEIVAEHNRALPGSSRPIFSIGDGVGHAMLLRGLDAIP